MPFARNNCVAVRLHKVHLHVRLAFLLEFRKVLFPLEEVLESSVCVHDTLLHGFTANLLDPLEFRIVGDEFIIKPFGKLHARHEALFFFVHFFVVSKIKVIDKPAYADCTNYFLPLLGCWIDFCLEAL